MKQPYMLKKLIAEPLDINLDCLHSLFDLLTWLEESKTWASKTTHYFRLEDWWGPYNQILHKNIDKFGFINGYGPTTPEGSFWWTIYQYDPTNSPNLKTQVSTHHASAYERAVCAKDDLEFIYDFYLKQIEEKMLNYLLIGVIVALVWQQKYKVTHQNARIGTIFGSLVGFGLIAVLWPISLIIIVFKK